MRSTAWDRTRLNDFPRYLSLDQAVTCEWTSSRKSLCLAFHFCCFYCFQAINLYVFSYFVYTQQIILMCCSRARPDSFSHTDGERVAFARRVYVDLIILILFYFYCAFNAFHKSIKMRTSQLLNCEPSQTLGITRSLRINELRLPATRVFLNLSFCSPVHFW